MSEKINISFPENFETVQPFEMNLETTTVPEYMPTPFEESVDPVLARGERGALNVGEMVDSTRLAWHGLKEKVREKRADLATERAEKMTHKDEYYAAVGALAMGTIAADEVPRRRSFAELVKSNRVDKKAQKYRMQAGIKARQTKIHGAAGTSSGLSAKGRTWKKAGVTVGGLRSGMSATELRQARTRVGAEAMDYGALGHERIDEELRKSTKKLNRATNQPALTRWRGWRRSQAEADARHHASKAEKHRQKREEIERG